MNPENTTLPVNTGLPEFWESILFDGVPVYYFNDTDDLADNDVILDNCIIICWGGPDIQVRSSLKPIGWRSFKEKITLRDILSLGDMKVIWPGVVQVWNHKGNSMWPSQQVEDCTVSIEKVQSFDVVANWHPHWRRTIPKPAWRISIHENSEGTSLGKEIPMPLGASLEGWRIVSDSLISENIVTKVQHEVIVIMSELYHDGDITRIDAFSRKVISGRLWVDFNLDELDQHTIVVDGKLWNLKVEDVFWAAEMDIKMWWISVITQKRMKWGNQDFCIPDMPGWEIRTYANMDDLGSGKPIDSGLASTHQVLVHELYRTSQSKNRRLVN